MDCLGRIGRTLSVICGIYLLGNETLGKSSIIIRL